jgi:hypothetical protein
MKRIVLTFGLIAGAILSAMLAITLSFQEAIGFDAGAVIGYTSMVAAFLLIFFGVRAYRDNVAGGTVTFGRAFKVGALIMLVASTCYVATWEVIYFGVGTDFTEKYQAHVLDKARADGATQEELERKRAELQRYARLYDNPAINVAVSFLEPLPVGLLMALLSAGVLSRKKRDDHATAAPVAAA